MTWYGYKRLLSNLEGKSRAHSCGVHIVILLVPYGVYIVILPVPCGVPVVLGVVEPAVVEVAAEVAGACSVAVGVVGATRAVGVDGVVLNDQQTKLLDKKILNDILNIKSVHIRFYLPEWLLLNLLLCLVWNKEKIIYFIIIFYDLKKGHYWEDYSTRQRGKTRTYSYASVNYQIILFFPDEIAFSF